MPWKIRDDHPNCAGYAVVKSDTGELVACHETEDAAKKQLAALYANEPQARAFEPLDELALVKNYRSLPFEVTDLEDHPEMNTVRFVGHAAVYDEETQFDIPGIGTVHEVIDRGAFRKVLGSRPQVPMLYNHDPNAILADTGNGTLKLKEDTRGLLAQAVMDRTDPDVQRVVAKINSGLVRGMSFGFVAGRENQRIEHRGNTVLRRLGGFKKLLDVGPVVGPAYSGTDVALRSALMEFADSSEPLQQILMGAYPQLEDGATGTRAGTSVETAGGPGATPLVAARERQLRLYLLAHKEELPCR
jgi:Escherichia/Staphylococcus phage prohead protease